MFNPFAAWPVTGTWADHMSYSLGGIDQPLGYGTPIRAPAAGTLRTSGGSGEYRAGLVGTAGRRAILTLDDSVLSLFAIVLQHLSRFAPEGHYAEGDVIGWSGASTIRSNGTVNEYGGDVHLHHHGLTQGGTRIDWRGFLGYGNSSTSSVSAGNTTALPGTNLTIGEEDMATFPIYAKGDKSDAVYALYVTAGDSNSANGFAGAVYSGRRRVEPGEFQIVEQLGWPHPKQSKLIVIPQANFDKINKLAGSL